MPLERDWSHLDAEIALYTQRRRLSLVERLIDDFKVLFLPRPKQRPAARSNRNEEEGGTPVLVGSPRGPRPLRHGAQAKPPPLENDG